MSLEFRLEEILRLLPELDLEPPDIEVVTPERLAHMVHRDPEGVLNRFGMFMFDEAQLIAEAGRGFTLESLLAFLHWRTRQTNHRIVLLSATMGNAGQLFSWIDVEQPGRLQESEWRGPRRLHAIFTTEPDWQQESRSIGHGGQYPVRLTYPLVGALRLRPAENAQPVHLRVVEPVGQLTLKEDALGRRGGRDQGRSTPTYKAAARMVTALGHAGAVLVVTSTRDAARRMAEELASLVGEEAPATRPLVDFARVRLGEAHPLVTTLRRGVAFHHAALPTDILEAIEDGVRDDSIRYLTCTSTLTEGINLPVRTVVIAETQYEGQPQDARLSGPRLVNALGRAGRAGKESEGWIVLVRSGKSTDMDFTLLTPDVSALEVRSRLIDDLALQQLAAFEESARTAEDAVFAAAGYVGDFIAFVWFILASQEELGVAAEDVDLETALANTLGYVQAETTVKEAWARAAESARTTYTATEPARRQRWAKPGTGIGTARVLDGLAARIGEAIVGHQGNGDLEPGSLSGALNILDNLGVFEELLGLPESPADWAFRTTRSGLSAEIPVDVRVLRDRWLRGDSLSTIADDLLGAVPDGAWRIEQMVDAVTGHFEHFLSWVVGALVELVNHRLSDQSVDDRLCPTLGGYLRYGVNTEAALGLMLVGIRSRRLALAIATQAGAGQTTGEIRTWLSRMSLPEWRRRFEASAAELLDLLDFARVRRRSILRMILETGQATLDIDLEADVDTDLQRETNVSAETQSQVSQSSDGGTAEEQEEQIGAIPVWLEEISQDPAPRRLGLYDADARLVGTIPLPAHNDMRSLLDTGLNIEATLTESALRMQLAGMRAA